MSTLDAAAHDSHTSSSDRRDCIARRILFIPSSVGLAHVQRLILIADELRRRGHVTAFAYGGSVDFVSARGHESFPVRDVTLDDFQGNLFAGFSDRATADCLEGQSRIIGAFNPDVIVADLHPVASISARLAGKPLVSVLNGYLTKYFDVTGHFIDRVKHPIKYWCADGIVRAILYCQQRALAAPFRRTARRLGVRGRNTLYEFLAGDLTLIAELPEFCPLRELADDYQFIGPLIWEALEGQRAPLAGTRTAGTSLYVTIGNTGSSALVDLVTSTFGGDARYHVIITTGAYVDPSRFRRHANIDIYRFVPGSRVMDRSDLVIHCGGNGTTYQCLANGLPSIAVPFTNDQRINARLAQKSGVGIALNAQRLDSTGLRQAVRHVLEHDRFRATAESFRARLRTRSAPALAADAVLGTAVPRLSA